MSGSQSWNFIHWDQPNPNKVYLFLDADNFVLSFLLISNKSHSNCLSKLLKIQNWEGNTEKWIIGQKEIGAFANLMWPSQNIRTLIQVFFLLLFLYKTHLQNSERMLQIEIKKNKLFTFLLIQRLFWKCSFGNKKKYDSYTSGIVETGEGRGAGGKYAPSDFGSSINPISTTGGQILPTNYYSPSHPQIFRPSAIPGMTSLHFIHTVCAPLKAAACIFFTHFSLRLILQTIYALNKEMWV